MRIERRTLKRGERTRKMVIQLITEAITISATLKVRGSYTSPNTECRLGRLEVELETQTPNEKMLIKELLQSRQAVETKAGDGTTVRWRIQENRHSFTSGSRTETHAWELFQIEDLELSGLYVDEMEFVPYEYGERFHNGKLQITARLKISQAEHECLRHKNEYVKVIREGINSTPREMRLGGRMLWSRKDDVVKIQVSLSDKDPEDNLGHSIFDPERSSDAIGVATSLIRIESLVEILKQKQVLTEPDAEQVLNVEKVSLFQELCERELVGDLDEWLDGPSVDGAADTKLTSE
jgi:hypothetical protein